ncbi:MAG: host attachment protein [Nitrosospira sp.]
MEKTWILVANRSGAKLFERTGSEDVKLKENIVHPDGRLKAHDIDTDAPTRTVDTGGHGQHGTGSPVSPTEHIAEQFAKKLGELLDKGRTDHAYTKLVLIAEPGFLGELRNGLDQNTAALVSKTIGKNLPDISEHDLPDYLDAE